MFLVYTVKLLSLTHLELRVLLADHVKTALTTNDLAILAALLDGCFDFHNNEILFVSERYSSLRQIIRRNLHLDFVSEKDVDKVHSHLS